MRSLLLLLGNILAATSSSATCPLFAAHEGTAPSSSSDPLVCPSIPAIKRWKSLKFGLMLTWGPSSQRVPYDQQWGEISWRLNYQTAFMFWKNAARGVGPACPKQNWANVSCPTLDEMQAYRDSYWGLAKTFNPTRFDADALVDWAKSVGFKYIMPITKHHDGFAMWPTAAAGDPTAVGTPAAEVYGVGGPGAGTTRDLIGEIADAAKAHDVVFGTYFSKADWHAGSFWDKPSTNPGTSAFPRYTGVNYNFQDGGEGSARFTQFKNFTAFQLEEVARKYKPALMWLDAPWMDTPQGYGNEIDSALGIPEQAARWKIDFPDMITVNRPGPRPSSTASPEGTADAYLTPEGGYSFSTNPMVPWETCFTMGQTWGFTPNNTYRNTTDVIRTLVDAVSKGGNVLLNIGPDEQGQLPADAVQSLEGVGDWLNTAGEGIFSSEPIWPFIYNLTRNDMDAVQLRMTQSRGSTGSRRVYVFVFLDGSDGCWHMPVSMLRLPFVVDGGIDSSWPKSKLGRVELLGSILRDVPWTLGDHGLGVDLGDNTKCLNSTAVATLRFSYESDERH